MTFNNSRDKKIKMNGDGCHESSLVTNPQGGESRDLLRLFYTCTCIWKERVRKLFIISLYSINFHAVKGRHLAFIRIYRLFKGFLLRAVFSHANSSVYENVSYIMACCKSEEVSALYPMKTRQVFKKQ